MVCSDLWVGIKILKDKGLANREKEGKKYHEKNQELQPMAFEKKKNNNLAVWLLKSTAFAGRPLWRALSWRSSNHWKGSICPSVAF